MANAGYFWVVRVDILVYNPRYSGGGGRRITVQSQPRGNHKMLSEKLKAKRAESVVHLPSMNEALNSITSTAEREREREREQQSDRGREKGKEGREGERERERESDREREEKGREEGRKREREGMGKGRGREREGNRESERVLYLGT
jgi:hypothetical protein